MCVCIGHTQVTPKREGGGTNDLASVCSPTHQERERAAFSSKSWLAADIWPNGKINDSRQCPTRVAKANRETIAIPNPTMIALLLLIHERASENDDQSMALGLSRCSTADAIFCGCFCSLLSVDPHKVSLCLTRLGLPLTLVF